MRSSTSNSDVYLTRRYVPEGRWLVPLLAACLITALVVLGLESLLASRGFVPTVVDSAALWSRERARVDRLGDRALVLVGASRIQLDVDVGTLRSLTGMEPVQLAIDGSSFVPVLADLADDERVTGTILVDYQDHVVGDLHRVDAAQSYVAQWRNLRDQGGVPTFASTEGYLGTWLHGHMRSFADGANPFDSLMLRVLDGNATQQYLITLIDRERLADYTKVQMPQFYFGRVMRNAGITTPPAATNWNDLNRLLASQIDARRPTSMPYFFKNAEVVAAMVRKIEARGGRVVFVAFPRSGLVRAADDRAYPRNMYWQTFIRIVAAPSLHYADVPWMASVICPDGSHLDQRDRVMFTRELVHALPLLKRGDRRVAIPEHVQ